ncbi:MAG TPA: acyl-CoA thioesterase domain-containing protein [Gammaproteobacteria bacterium]|nr:acyl-CoA thioesterase domain-containing protein [Gammaproteobacteria bacterium]
MLRAIALNRTPGFHFPGNFVELSFDRVDGSSARVSYETDAQDPGDFGSLAVLADFALGTAVRTGLDPATRLATVSMTLELAAAPRAGIVTAAAQCHGFVGEGDGRIGRGRVVLEDASGEIGYGSGAFMVLKPRPQVALHPVPLRKRGDPEPPVLAARDLAPEELRILRHADAALERAARTAQPFSRHFWGFLPQPAPGGAMCVMPNGPHVGNRVGYVQGGILLGLAVATAEAALPETWMLSAVAAAFVSPGEGPALRAQASLVHRGQRVSVIRTEVTRGDGRRVLEAVSTHVARPG